MNRILADKKRRRLIFMDGEFTQLSPFGTKFLSIALITDEDKELYLEIHQNEKEIVIDKWVYENVIPYLNAEVKFTEAYAKERIIKFVKENYGDEKPILVADVNQFDWMGICGLFGVWNVPFFYFPIDLTSSLLKNGIDIDINRLELAESLGINTKELKQHIAIDDCRVVKEIWGKLESNDIRDKSKKEE